MNVAELEHPTGAVLTAYGLGKLNEEELAGIDRHLAECATCRRVLEGVPPDTLLMLLRSSATEPDSSADNGKLTGLHATSKSTATQIAPRQALMDHPRYRVGDLIGVGGMGAVYKAEHLLMQRPVAVKVLNHELIDNPATVDRFRREVRAAARLTHPNIVAAFDAEQAGDVHFLAMEYVEGVSLARRCAEYGPLPVAEACSYARQAALGLQHAHECGMVHRDIKPQNLMLTPGGQVKILDFGLARFVMESAPAGALLPTEGNPAPTSGLDSKAKPLTQIGVVMGTPDYIAPEQAQDSHQADIRADIYSLGCTLYDTLAGHAPFPDGNAVQKIKAHLHKTPPPLKTLRRDVPLELVRVIERTMAKDPAQRYQTPAEVAAALAPFTSSGPPRRKKWPLLVAALGFVVALVLGAVIYVQTDRGIIVIETNDDKIAVMIEKAGGVKIVDQANKREYLLRPGAQDVPRGDYQIEVSETLAGLEFQTKKFELKRGKEVRLTATFVAKGDGGKVDIAVFPKRASSDEGPLFKGKPASFWLDQFNDANLTFRSVALDALGALASKNKDLIPVLVNALGDKSDRIGSKAMSTLGSLGPDAVPALLEVLKDNDSPISLRRAAEAVGYIGDIGPKAKAAVPLLLQALKMNDWNVRCSATYALGRIGPDAKTALPVMIDVLGDFLKSGDSLKSVGEPSAPFAFTADFRPQDFPHVLARALKQLDPEIQDFPPQSRMVKNLDEAKRVALLQWQKAYDVLKKRYQTQTGAGGQASAAGGDLQQELAKFQGTWAIVKQQIRWEITPTPYKYVFNGNSITVMRDPTHIDFIMTFDIDPTKNPAAIDIHPPLTASQGSWISNKTSFGIYEFVDNTLTICVRMLPSGGERPISFVDTDKTLSIVILKKADKALDGTTPALTPIERQRAKERLETLKQIAARKERGYQGGKVSFDEVLTAKRDAARAELALADSDAERVKTHEKVVALAQEVAKFRQAQYQAAQITEVAVLQAKADLLEALTDLDRAKGKSATPDSVIPKQASGDQGPLFGGKPASFWLQQLQDANAEFRVEAVKALGVIAQKDKQLIPVLVTALKDQDAGPGFRFEAVKALGVLARKDKELVPVLVAALKDQDAYPGFRFEAVRVLGVIARKDKELIPVLATALKDKDSEVGYKAAEVLGALGPQSVPALMDVLRSKASPSAMCNAIAALGRIGPEAKAAVPLLSQALKMDKWVGAAGETTWRSAIIVLGRIGPEAKPAIPAMIDLLGDYLEELDAKAEPSGGGGKKGKGGAKGITNFGVFDPSFLAVLGTALTQIDPHLKEVLPSDNPFQNGEAHRASWHKAYDNLKKRYPKQTGTSGQAGTADADLKQELARFEGTWTLAKQQVRWETTSPGTKHIISGTTMTIVEGNDVDAMHRTAEVEFMRYDRNSDGFLEQEEMPPQLKGELGKWDTNRDNLISLDEYKLYYAARVQNRRAKEHIIGVLTFKIDPSKTPKTIDLYRNAKGEKEASTGLGIYEFTGDTLKICVGIGTDAPRPTTFADTEKNLSIAFLKKGEPAQAAVGSSKPDQGPLFGGKKGGKRVGDRNRVFDILANGRAYFLISDVSPRLGNALWQYLKDKGITNGQVTREIFEAFNDDGSQLSAGEEDIKSEQAIKALGGAVVRNPDAPGRPIIHVDFFGTHVTDAGLKELAGLKSLQTLNLEGTGVTDAGLKDLAGLKSLRVLNLCVTKVTDEGLKDLSALMGLQSLSLQQTNATDLKGLKGLISLKKLDLWHTKVTDAGLKELKDLHSLQDLSLRGTNVTDAGLKELKDLHSLQGLSLHHTNVTDAGLKELASLQSLHTLDLGFTRVTDAGLKELAGFKNLQKLYLIRTQVTDAGLKELGGLVSLRTLNLHNCKITNAGLRELARLQSLRELVLIGTQVTDAGVAELQKALPKCNITRRDPRKVP